MKLLLITQKVDRNDPILGFFHNWILKFSEKFKEVSVICLEKGEYNLPKNVRVFSLGKESKKSKIKYVVNLYRYILGLYADYDAVFIHMNQEYILLGGFLWKILRKRIYFWRNHQHGSLLTEIAVWLSDKVFCTSKFAFVSKYKKTSLMPVGIDLDKFKIQNSKFKIEERENKILFLGRISPIKRPELLIEALGILKEKNLDFICDFYGDPLSEDENYYDSLKARTKELGLENKVNFYEGIPNHETPEIYGEHNLFVNLTPSGSFDKTILEAAACGCMIVAANKSLIGDIDNRMIIKNDSPDDIARTIDFWLNTNDEEKIKASEKLREYVVKNHSLNILMDKLSEVFFEKE